MLCDVDESNGRIDFETLNKQVLLDISEAKTLADIVIVCPHWGTEYSTTPSSTQEKFAMQMTEAGADIIIGTHPHVVQPVKWIEATNGNRALCYYSLGNYVSTQKNGQSMLEGMAWITFHVTKTVYLFRKIRQALSLWYVITQVILHALNRYIVTRHFIVDGNSILYSTE